MSGRGTWARRSVPVACRMARTTLLLSAADENLESRNMKAGGGRGRRSCRESQLKAIAPNGTLSARAVREAGPSADRSISVLSKEPEEDLGREVSHREEK
jgi:hypothetical protein